MAHGVQGPLLIHAGLRIDAAAEVAGSFARAVVALFPLSRSAIRVLFWARLTSWTLLPYAEDLLADPWACGPWCWKLANPRPLVTPIRYKGQLSLFEVDENLNLFSQLRNELAKALWAWKPPAG